MPQERENPQNVKNDLGNRDMLFLPERDLVQNKGTFSAEWVICDMWLPTLSGILVPSPSLSSVMSSNR